MPEVLAVGGELKNTICLTRGKHAFLSQHVGDLENLESYNFFEEAIEHLQKVLEVRPGTLAHDLHPDYFSTRWAMQQQGMPRFGVQHHHAHIASCMGEHNLDGRVIGIALDGTGLGLDGHIWGGEVLLAGYEDFERAAHVEYVPLPGGEAAIREPWRMAVAYLVHHFGSRCFDFDIPFVRDLDHRRASALLPIVERRIHSPLTSSCGRLFDAVAALTGIRSKINYEAQAAIELENAIDNTSDAPPYGFGLRVEGNNWIIETRPMLEELIRDVQRKVSAGVVSRRFHEGLVEVFTETAVLLRDRAGLERVCLSGGTFNNVYLARRLENRLSECGFQVYAHRQVPCGDGGLSLGQALVAAHRAKLKAL
jgi:hydrogenase maturation protein HypF